MTPAHSKLLDFVRAYRAEYSGVSPSYDECAAALGLRSKAGVYRMVRALEARGLIRREAGPNHARCLVPADEPVIAHVSDFERGRRVGRDEGYRAAIVEFGRVMQSQSPLAETPSPCRASPSHEAAAHRLPVEISPDSRRPFLFPREAAQ